MTYVTILTSWLRWSDGLMVYNTFSRYSRRQKCTLRPKKTKRSKLLVTRKMRTSLSTIIKASANLVKLTGYPSARGIHFTETWTHRHTEIVSSTPPRFTFRPLPNVHEQDDVSIPQLSRPKSHKKYQDFPFRSFCHSLSSNATTPCLVGTWNTQKLSTEKRQEEDLRPTPIRIDKTKN